MKTITEDELKAIFEDEDAFAEFIEEHREVRVTSCTEGEFVLMHPDVYERLIDITESLRCLNVEEN